VKSVHNIRALHAKSKLPFRFGTVEKLPKSPLTAERPDGIQGSTSRILCDWGLHSGKWHKPNHSLVLILTSTFGSMS